METLQAHTVVEENSAYTPPSSEEQEDQQVTAIKDKEKEEFEEWLKANVPSRKQKTHKKKTFSEEMLKAIDSDGQDIRSWREYLDKAKLCFDKRMGNPELPLVDKMDFEIIKTLGIGAFGKVLLVKHIDTKTYYAAKLLSKAVLVRDHSVQRARNEKLILQSIRFVFTIHLEFFFQDNVYLFFIMPLIPGGELFKYLLKVNRLEEGHARFYTAQIILALEYLHYVGLIFRDLKPENILIDSIGYLKLADFGLCKAVELRTYTFCGTGEYLSPEVLNYTGYGKSIDWWTFGVLLYELCAGYTPFYSKLQSKMYDNIIRCRYRFPYYFSNDLKDLIKNILQLDLTRRYGNLKKGADDIKEHDFYNDVPWLMLLNREIQAPYVPVITRLEDIKHFKKNDDRPLYTTTLDLYHKEFVDF